MPHRMRHATSACTPLAFQSPNGPGPTRFATCTRIQRPMRSAFPSLSAQAPVLRLVRATRSAELCRRRGSQAPGRGRRPDLRSHELVGAVPYLPRREDLHGSFRSQYGADRPLTDLVRRPACQAYQVQVGDALSVHPPRRRGSGVRLRIEPPGGRTDCGVLNREIHSEKNRAHVGGRFDL